MNILALDFDGVLCDSIIECLITSYNSVQVLEGEEGKRVYSLEGLPANWIKQFRLYRPLVRVAREYYLLWKLIREDYPIDPKTDIHAQCPDSVELLQQFQSVFFDERRRWMSADFTAWLNANPFFPFIASYLSPLFRQDNVVIVSAKNRDAIDAILRHNGCEVAGDCIWGADSGMDKEEIFRHLARRYSIPLSRFWFLDDNLDNAVMAKTLGVNVLFALWGYAFSYQKEQALEMGIPCMMPENISDITARFQ